jgi:hypothetical protein
MEGFKGCFGSAESRSCFCVKDFGITAEGEYFTVKLLPMLVEYSSTACGTVCSLAF